ncbi:transient receptor potential cation channel subfamily M member-like 2 [Mytilus trossulus]|uniref:transient receptor potential cation channel subfamily M member-like 2 n=1 Tax=Mytilus trossulus TaxID=6551 RepID=UPI003006F3E1
MLGIIIAYSAFLLSNVKGMTTFNDIGVYELVLYIWIIADAVEEIIRNIVITMKRNGTHHPRKLFRLYCYLTNFWNVLALMLYSVLVSAVLVRTFNGGQRMEIRLYSFGLFLIYMRFFHSLMVLKYFGLKLIMIGKMLKELLQFSWILIVFIVCAGVMYHSNMYPNHRDMWPQNGADMEHWRIWKILSLPYWQLYGELSLDQLRGETNSNGTCTSVESEWESNPDMERCVEYDWAIMVIAAMYMLISNLLLFNLIIALFSYRFEEVQNNSDRLWKYRRFAIIRDYSTRFPVPLNVLFHIVNSIYNCRKRKHQNPEEKNKDLSMYKNLIERKHQNPEEKNKDLSMYKNLIERKHQNPEEKNKDLSMYKNLIERKHQNPEEKNKDLSMYKNLIERKHQNPEEKNKDLSMYKNLIALFLSLTSHALDVMIIQTFIDIIKQQSTNRAIKTRNQDQLWTFDGATDTL